MTKVVYDCKNKTGQTLTTSSYPEALNFIANGGEINRRYEEIKAVPADKKTAK